MPPRKPQSNARRELVSQEILERAAALFAERGFASTSLQDVAAALDISRTALYHYIGSKEELLGTLVRGLTQETAEQLQRIAADESLDPIGRLEAAIEGMARRIATRPGRFRLLALSESSLPDPLAAEHQAAKREVLERLAGIVREGVASGALRPLDERVAALGLLGMCNWIAWWSRPERGDDAERIAREVARMGVAAVQAPAARGAGAAGGKDDVAQALGALRENVERLERALDARETVTDG